MRGGKRRRGGRKEGERRNIGEKGGWEKEENFALAKRAQLREGRMETMGGIVEVRSREGERSTSCPTPVLPLVNDINSYLVFI